MLRFVLPCGAFTREDVRDRGETWRFDRGDTWTPTVSEVTPQPVVSSQPTPSSNRELRSMAVLMHRFEALDSKPTKARKAPTGHRDPAFDYH
jgi:hypothetical protein